MSKSKKPKVVRCKNCSDRVEDHGVGFQPYYRLKCSRFQMNVSPDDGCTFGHKGESDYIFKRNNIDVTISGHETVWGCK